MPAHIFISYDHGNAVQVEGFRGLIRNPNHALECHDRSLPSPVRDRHGQIIALLPDQPSAEPVRVAIRRLFEKCSRLVVLIGDDTHSSRWVEWEIKEFFRLKSSVGSDAAKRIRGMRLKSARGGDPAALTGRSAPTLGWDPAALHRWFESPI